MFSNAAAVAILMLPSAPATPVSALDTIVPAPAQVNATGRDFHLSRQTVIETRVPRVGDLLAKDLLDATGLTLRVEPSAAPAAPTIKLGIEAGHGDEGYRLDIDRTSVEVKASTPAGLHAGAQSLLQARRGRAIAGGSVTDAPRFGFRGAFLDLARHFHTPDEVKSYIDEISRLKVNYLHLHLSDDQGWRIQIDSWPRLTEVSGGPGTGVGGVGGGFLTKDQYQDLVGYAAARFVTVIPEIDVPGHTNAALVAYPELTCDGVAPAPRTDTAVGYSSLCTSKDVTYRFVEDVIRELAEITPGPYIHIGGDETHATSAADYLAFEQRMLPMVAAHGKVAYGWHEVAQSPAAHTSVAQFWGTGTSNAALAAAVTHGTRVVMSPANKTYLDMKYDRNTRPGLTWAGLIEVRTAYDWNPGTHVSGVPESSVLGVEAPLWSETLRSLDDIEFMAFPRLAAIAELGWSPASTHDWESFRGRLAAYGPQWAERGVDFYRSPQISW